LKQIALGMHVYADAHGGYLPPAAIYSKEGKPLLSWRVLLLPYLEETELYKRFHIDEPWDSPHNLPLLKEMPRIYMRPRFSAAADEYCTIYQVFVGKGTVFESPKGMSLGTLTGMGSTSNTMLVVDVAQRVPWTKPGDPVYAEDQPLPPLGGLFKDRGFRPFSSESKPTRFQAAFADGHVQNIPLPETFGEERIRSFILYERASQAQLP
jgi:prepilin-type processing-associated H-X9-DG protein